MRVVHSGARNGPGPHPLGWNRAHCKDGSEKVAKWRPRVYLVNVDAATQNPAAQTLDTDAIVMLAFELESVEWTVASAIDAVSETLTAQD